MALGILHGMIDELYSQYRICLNAGLSPGAVLIGSGNGLRCNQHLQRIAADTFGLPLTLSENAEEAAAGAALFARILSR